MVFPGALSRGCDRCRKRKIKCDGRRPGCKRCELYKASCPGYDRPLAFRFHGEPGHSLVRGEPSARRKSVQTLVLSKGSSSYALTHSRLTSLVAARQPQPSFEDESIAFFLQEYCVHPAPGVIGGHLDFLEAMYRDSSRSSCIRPATLAIAYMALSRHYKSSTLYVAARSHYGAALRTVNRDLSVSKRPLKDETLASLMLMGMIEDIECQGQTTKAVHMAGISKLFDVVGHRVLTNVKESSLHSWIFTQMQLPSLVAKESMQCLAIPDAQLDTKSHVVRLALVVTRIGQFYRASKQITASDSALTPVVQQAQLVSLIKQALAIAGELAMIQKNAMPTKLRPHETTDKRPKNPANQSLISFDSRWTASRWSQFALYLILFFERLSKCSDALLQLETIGEEETQLARAAGAISEGQIRAMIYKLCSALPYLMGEVDKQGRPLSVPERQSVIMYHLVWPLSVVIVSSHSTLEQVEDGRTRLNAIRDMYGIKLAYFAPDLARDLMA
ncbi:arginine metabolism regulation protein ii [Fusarium sporotrichioides]|uniref:Arginine metabolism regulation protein ii n=1 Tax=Fusarium sporotrichioides TaxID=5514 RepID=A0A395RHV0_FUSSP|nr:arginine metabolism regulation protein ii [Fusarium sporotrichioides]